MRARHGKRELKRVSVRVIVSILPEEGPRITGSATNLGMQGLYVTCHRKLPVGTKCFMTLMLRDGHEEIRVEAKGKVIRTDKEGMALSITEVTKDSYEHLRDVVLRL